MTSMIRDGARIKHLTRGAHLLPKAGARDERTLEAVSCKALFGPAQVSGATVPDTPAPPRKRNARGRSMLSHGPLLSLLTEAQGIEIVALNGLGALPPGCHVVMYVEAAPQQPVAVADGQKDHELCGPLRRHRPFLQRRP